MNSEEKELLEELKSFKVEELYNEVKTRNYRTIPDQRFQKYSHQTVTKALKSSQKVIYGVDDREDLYQVDDQPILDMADSVVSLFWASDVIDNGDGTSTLVTQNYGNAWNLCQNEPFRDQPIGAFCSGFLVGRNIIATAGHCVDSSNLASIRFVFGFRMIDANNAQTVISNNEIFSGESVIARVYTANKADWALVRLSEPAINHNIASIRRDEKIPDNQAVYVIGHPMGLPIKVAGGANVRTNTPLEYFVANLDTYGGNSGSPVINSDNHVVEGILVRGETDLTTVNPGTPNACNVSLVCPNSGCSGEDCTRTTEFAEHVPWVLIFRDTRLLEFLKYIIYGEILRELIEWSPELDPPRPPWPPWVSQRLTTPSYSAYPELGYYADITISNISPDISLEVRDENNIIVSESHRFEDFQHLRIPLKPNKKLMLDMKGKPINKDVKLQFEISKLSRKNLAYRKNFQFKLKRSIEKFQRQK
ncbi:MAG: trypsin-like serine peptidase [Candidatus Kariarchaeaceae archaeon]|jgi:hypothetical protein